MTPPSGEGAEPTPYQRFGGHEFFTNLVHNFYQRVPKDPVLREMYPSQDLEGAEWRLRAFLEQYWGGRKPIVRSAGTLDSGCVILDSTLIVPHATAGSP